MEQQFDELEKFSIDGSLGDFIIGRRENRRLIRVGIVAIFLQFIAFKYFYPFPSFINGDSYVYLESAYHNFTVNTYPIGYSKFLRFISVFTHSDIVVVAVQYALLEFSAVAFMFTIFYFYRPGRFTRILLFFVLLLNPVYLYLSNYISSDSFFLSLSLIWFTLLLWIINKPSNNLIFTNAVVLFVAFSVRYNALFYPVISLVALVLIRRKVWTNLLGFGLSLILIFWFVHVASNKYKKITGYYQFAPFTGWQMANNGMYAYRYVDSAQRKPAPIKLKALDSMVRNYFDSSRDVNTHPIEAVMASTVYMWDPRSPLSIYAESQFKGDTLTSALKKWATVAPVMKEYGSFLIRTYPREFFRFYLVPNALKYYAPPVEFLQQYSTGVDSVNETAKVWFDYDTRKISTRVRDFEVSTLDFYPVLTGTMNVVFVLSAVSFVFLQGYKQHPQLRMGLILVVVLWAVNFGFSVFASPIALRFQLFPILVSLVFTVLLFEFLVKSAKGAFEVKPTDIVDGSELTSV